jgi:cytidylate kinase
MIVTIQRELGAGGLSVGEALAAEFNATLLDERSIVERLAARGGFSADYLQRIDERPPTFANSFMSDLARATAIVQAMEWKSSEHTVLDEIRSLVLETAQDGNVVVIGHGGRKLLSGHMLEDDLFSMLLHAHRDWRIEQLMRRFSWTREEATDRVQRTDELRKRYLRHFFSCELYDATVYDLVIDTERTGIDTAIELSKTAVNAVLKLSRA